LNPGYFDERCRVYRDPRVAQFLATLSETGEEIRPKYDLNHGYIYPEVELLTGRNPRESGELLETLSNLRILEKKLFDMAIYCPSCGSTNVSTNYVCPFCSSPRLAKNALIQHIACGFIDSLRSYEVNGSLVCPRCKAKLQKDNYKSAGTWYECISCGKHIEVPRVIHICRESRDRFTFDEARYVDVYSYALSKIAVDEIKNGVLFSHIAERFFTDLDAEVEIPGKLVGGSGIEHEFDILLKRNNGKSVAISVVISDKQIGQDRIMSEYSKMLDTKAEVYIVVCPSLTDDARRVAELFKIFIVEGKPLEAFGRLRTMLV